MNFCFIKRLAVHFCFLMLVLFPSLSFSQVSISALPFLETNHYARSMGMGGATVALNHDQSGVHLNPATIGQPGIIESSTQFMFNGFDPNLGTITEYSSNETTNGRHLYTPQINIRFDSYGVAYQFTKQITYARSEAGGSRTDLSEEQVHTIASSYRISEYFSIGAGINYYHSEFTPVGTVVGGNRNAINARGLTLDLGFLAQHSVEKDFAVIKPSVGWSLTDFGGPVSYTEGQEDPIHMMMRGGIGIRFESTETMLERTVASVGIYGSLSKLMARVDTTGQTMGPFKALFKSWDTFYRYSGSDVVSLPLKDQIRRQSGIEFTLMESFSVRFGKHVNNAIAFEGNRSFTTFGLGVRYRYFSLDYVEFEADENYLGRMPLKEIVQLTANIPLNRLQF